MPQLDVSTYASQVFWLLVTFAALYWVLAKAALPRIARVLEDRRRHIDQDLEKAEKLKGEAEAALAAYADALAKARRQAQDELRRTAEQAAAKAAAAQAELAARLNAQVKAAEARIAAARGAALGQIQGLAAELAGVVAERLSGERLPAPELEQAVGAALRERG